MAKTTERFSALKIANLKAPGYFADGGNLYLRVAPSGARGWIFRFGMQGRTRDMGLGAYPEISLAAARRLAAEYREVVKKGLDPIEQRRADKNAQRVKALKSVSFDECVQQYIDGHEAAWKNAKHRAQWSSTLKRYASPVFGKLPVSEIDDGLVLRVLKPIWTAKTETAARLRGRIEAVLDWARVNGYRTGENPARWKGHLRHSLPARSKISPVQHHAALSYDDAAAFVSALQERKDDAARALEFIILTATRTGEALGATWDEFDFENKIWTVPAERMKAGKEHRVPLTSRAIAILQQQQAASIGDFVFAGRKQGSPLSQMSCLMLLRRMGRSDITVHGFRSTFRDWAAERTNFPREVAEMALAHTIASAVEAAYRRGDLFEKRRCLMDAWADYCATPIAFNDVVPLRRREPNSGHQRG